MNNTGNIADVLSGNKPLAFEVKLETKSLIILGAVIVMSAIIVLMVKKLYS